MLEGTSYTICTDHKPLVTALSKTSDAWTSRQQRHLSTIAETCCTIEYLPGKQNAVVDALSRVEISTIQLGVNYQDLAAAQLTDPETEDAKTSITNLKWKVVKIGETSLLCDISTGRPRSFVPKCFRRNIFEMIHTSSLLIKIFHKGLWFSIKQKHLLQNIFEKDPTEENKLLYKRHINLLTTLMRNTERLYHENQLELNKHDL